ncbi:MAG: nitronate monooxygenase, partial [Gammaproteobacteria bacterium]|nr:nitronate monooxygenase [Gammaproteobacteria bacterium]
MTAHPALNTSLCQLTGIKYPVVQPGMGWVADGRLTAATANAGGLGIIGSATMSLDQLVEAVAYVKDHTTQPFGVNLRSDSPDVFERAHIMIKEG